MENGLICFFFLFLGGGGGGGGGGLGGAIGAREMFGRFLKI